MPRKPRAVMWRELGYTPPGFRAPEGQPKPLPMPEPPPAMEEAPTEPWWHITEVLRVRCPLCGMLPEAFRLDKSPYEVEVKLQRFGGRLKGGRGFMVYETAPEERAAPVKEKLKEKLTELCRLFGLKGEGGAG
uniref:Uncharacterized protein n=1 Tax=Ammonifex degensii TaxID=42838 RepID=A0A7C1J000_9THEO